MITLTTAQRVARLSVPLALAVVLSTAPPAAARPGPRPCPTSAPDAAGARAAALRCGGRVENLAARTEKKQIFANPSGTSTLEVTAVPKRVRRADGTWVPTDPTLVRVADGSIRPTASTVDVRFSRGGTEPLVTVAGKGTERWTMSWLAALPAPTVHGDSVTYAGVLPGVDLVLRALVDGFTHVLVVRDATAAANPALREVRFLTSGQEIVTRGTALMWDSTRAPGALASSAAEPGESARRAEIPVRTAGDDIVLTPDRALLDDPTTVYPVYIDPPWGATYSWWAYANNTNMNNSDGKAWVGRDPWYGNIYRSYFDMDLSDILGTYVVSASVSAGMYHSWSCNPTPVYLYRTNHTTSSPRSAWHSVPIEAYLDQAWGNAHKTPEYCGWQPDQTLWFNGNLTGDVRMFVANYWWLYTIGFCACSYDWAPDEGNTERWKKFYVDQVGLHVEFNRYPGIGPAGGSPSNPCVTGADRPAVPGGATQMSAVATDWDEGAVLSMRSEYSVDGGPWTALAETAGQASGGVHSVFVPNPSPAGTHVVAWHAYAFDGTSASNWGPTCEFTVDAVVPNLPVLTTTGILPPYPISPPPGVKVGSTTLVPVNPGGGDTDVVGYWYAVGTSQQSPPRQLYAAAAADGSAALSVVPVVSGLAANWLTVQAVDRAGNVSAERVHQFRANPAS